MRRLLWFSLASFALLIGCASSQRHMLYFPTHEDSAPGLAEWRHNDKVIGFARMVDHPRNVWLLLHGNGGQAAHRRYALPCFAAEDSVYILEYPGYGRREGYPSLAAINTAAREGYELLRTQFPTIPVCVAGESIGTGPGSFLATLSRPPDKIVLIVPFAVLKDVADEHYPFLPTSLLLRDNWNNVSSLQNYGGPLEIFAAKEDAIIPIRHARALAASKPKAVFHEIAGGHNEWSSGGRVTIRNP